MAQDTISGAFIHDNYLYRSGIYFDSNSFPQEILKYHGSFVEWYVRCIPNDTLTVYGIAAILGNPKEWGDWWMDCVDTTEASANSFLRLALPSADSAIWVRQVEVNPFFTPTAYFVNFAGPGPSAPPYGDWRDRLYLERVVEQEFEPFQVYDTFYVGKTFYGSLKTPIYDDNGNWLYHTENHIEGSIGEINLPKDVYDTVLSHWIVPDSRTRPNRWETYKKYTRYTFMYPMIVPPDTTASDTTTAISPAQFVDRMVGISPNPTSGRVKVVSNFGITKIEAYDLSGTLVATPLSKQEGSRHLSFTFNTDTWPTGTYVLRIQTPMGPAVKKLTVAR
jgi:hypothetical protein